MKAMAHIFFVLLILFLPITATLAAENALCRAPDFYSYEFTKTEVSGKLDSEVGDKELAKFFSDFMCHKTDVFLYKQYDKEAETEFFTDADGVFMAKFRFWLDLFTGVLAGTALISFWGCLFFIRRDEKDRLRFAVKLSAAFYLVLWIGIFVVTIYFHSGASFPEEAFFRLALTSGIVREWLFAGFLCSGLILGIIASLIWKFSKPARMFW